MKIASENVKDVMALSPMQESMLFSYLVNKNHEKYIAQVCYRLIGTLKMDMIIKSWELVIHQNDALRTIFRWEKLKEPIQIILKQHLVNIQIIDLRGRRLKNLKSFIKDEMIKDRRDRFDIRKTSYRIKIYWIADKEAYMLLSDFSIIYDGWSNSIMINEFLCNYHNLVDRKVIKFKEKREYKDYISWLKAQSQKKYYKFWSNCLEDYNILQIKRDPEKDFGEKCAAYRFSLSSVMEKKIKNYVAQSQITLASFLYALWALWNFKFEDIIDILFGVTVSGRPSTLEGMESVMGVFINTIPLRVRIDPSMSFYQLASNIHEFMIKAKEYENYPLAKIKSCCKKSRNSKLFNTLIVIQNYPIEKYNNKYVNIELFDSYDHTDFDIVIGVLVWDSINIDIRYDPEMFTNIAIQKIETFFLEIINEITKNKKNETLATLCKIENATDNTDLTKLQQLKELEFNEIF